MTSVELKDLVETVLDVKSTRSDMMLAMYNTWRFDALHVEQFYKLMIIKLYVMFCLSAEVGKKGKQIIRLFLSLATQPA